MKVFIVYQLKFFRHVFYLFISDQCLELGKASQDDNEPVRGQIIISLLSRDGPCGGTPLAVVGPQGELRGPSDCETSPTENDELPPGWEERRTSNGRLYYVNRLTRSTQWIKPQPVIKNQSRNARVNNQANTTDNNCNVDQRSPQENMNNNHDEVHLPVSTPSSSTSPVSPIVSPQKEQIIQLRPAPPVMVSSPQSDPVRSQNYICTSPTSTVVLAPNNTSCNVTNSSNGLSPGSQNMSAMSPQIQRPHVRDRRQRSSEERNSDNSARRRSGRNRNSLNAAHLSPQPASVASLSSRLDLPPGYGRCNC